MHSVFWRTRFLLMLLAVGAMALCHQARALQVIPMTMEETAYHAEAIFIGRVTAAQARWGSPAQRWIVTDYAFDIEETLLPNAEVRTGGRIALPFWGGTMNGESQALGGLEHPVIGQRYLIMLRPNYRGPGATPAVGIVHGLLRVAPGANGVEEIREYEGQPLYRDANGAVLREDFLPGDGKARSGVTRAAFTGWLRANLARIKATPPPVRPTPDPNDPRLIRTIAKTPREDMAMLDMGVAPAFLSPLAPEDNGFTAPQPQFPAITNSLIAPETQAQRIGRLQVQYVINRSANVPIVWNQLPTNGSFSPWSPEDQYQMSNWNYYLNDVFRVRTSPTGTFAWQDGVSDICGWLSEATLNSVYGLSWSGGVLAWTKSRWFGNDPYVESDISLNVGVSWTLDQNWVLDGGGAYSFRQVLSHELGHAHGLGHEGNYVALMRANVPGVYAAFSMPYMDDAEGGRANYPSRANNRTDLAIYLFYRASSGSWFDATYPSAVVAGNSFSVTNYTLQNTGTNTVGTPTLEWYLTRQRDYNATYYGVGSTTYPALGRFTYFDPPSTTRTLTVPAGAAAGDYYLNAFIRNDGGPTMGPFPFGNNFGWSRTKITVRPRLLSVSLSPSTVVGGQSSTGTASISTATPTAISVFTQTSDGSVAFPQNATINAGASSGTFAISTSEVNTNRFITITGNLYGISTSATLTVTPNIFAPVNLTANGVGATQIDLHWQDRSAIENGFRIERKEGVSGTWQQIATVGANSTSFSDSGLSPETTYVYRVRAYSGGLNSAYTNEAAARTRQTFYTINGKVTDNGIGLFGVQVQAGGDTASYFNRAPGLFIPDLGTITDTLTVPNSGSLLDVHVNLNLSHTYIGDLRVTLIAPNGTAVILHNRAGGSADNIVTLYPDVTAPAESLTALNGTEVSGNWRLKVEDLASGDTGTLSTWSLELKYNSSTAASATTNFSGDYSLAVPAGDYTVTPSATYYAFTPASQAVTVTSDVFGVNFATVPNESNSISGRVITPGGLGLPGINVQAYSDLPGTFTSSRSPGSSILDFTTREDIINVPTDGVVTGVRVGVSITHSFIGDLRVTLIAPDGTAVILHNRTGGGTDNIVTTYPTLTAPAQSLATLNSHSLAGNWKLRVEDLAGGDVGTFNAWSLSVDYVASTLVGQTYTQGDGSYVINGLPETVYTVLPNNASFTFTPVSQAVTIGPSAAGVDFTADGAISVVSGVVQLEEVVNSVQTVTFEFRTPGGGGTLFTVPQTLGAAGEFAIAVPSGAYDLTVKGPKWLRQMISVDVSAGDISDVSLFLPGGDSNDDNSADALDLADLITAFNTALGDEGYNPAADFNCDDADDALDLAILITNFNTSGVP